MANAYRSLIFIALPLLQACAGMQQNEQALGLLGGRMQFISVAPALRTFLETNPAVSSMTAVKVYPAGEGDSSAIGGYTALNAAVSTSVWDAAKYSLNPPVTPTGTAFFVEVDSLSFSNGVAYRFGYRGPNGILSLPSAQVTPIAVPPPVPPDPGTTKNLVECAVMANVVLRFTGAPEDIAALGQPATGQARCTVAAAINEAGSWNGQATSAPATLGVSDLLAGGQSVSLPVRADGSSVRFTASCSTTPPTNSGFQLDASGQAAFSGYSEPAPVSCAAQSANAAIDIVVRRGVGGGVGGGVGTVRGRFDISGYTESDAWVQVAVLTPDSWQFTSPTLSPLPSGLPEPLAWQVAGVRAGDVEISAGATLDGGRVYLNLPHLSHPNPVPYLAPGGDLDVGATFIARPTETRGKLVLLDPWLRTRLGTLATGGTVGPYGNSDTSYVKGIGIDEVADRPPGSGVWGETYGRLEGSYVPTLGCLGFPQGCWPLDYPLLFSGLSPVDGALDGSETRRTPWKVERLHLAFRENGNRTQSSELIIGRSMQYFSLPPGEAPAPLPDLAVCFGQIELDMRVDESVGKLFDPSFASTNFYSDVTGPTLSGDIKNVSLTADGTPTHTAPATTATVVATVPEGARYLVTPSVSFIAANGGAITEFSNLPPISIPESVPLACGRVARACLKIAASGTATPLSISLGDQPNCRLPGDVTVPVTVNASDVPVDRISYTLDGVMSRDVCTNCILTPTPQLGPLPVSLGSHSLEVTAECENGCKAMATYDFQVAPAPQLQCPAAFTVILPGNEDSILASDPRIASRLNAQASGGCGTLDISDNRPLPPNAFPVGTTTVRYRLNDVPACTTDVTVIRSSGQPSAGQLAYFDGGTLTLLRLANNQPVFPPVAVPGGAGTIVFNTSGSKLAVRSRNRVTILNALTGMADPQITGNMTDFAFRPGTADVSAYIEGIPGQPLVSATVPTVVYPTTDYLLHLKIAGTYLLPIAVPAPPPVFGVALSPARVIWSPDGSRLAVAFSRTAPGENKVFLHEWTFVGGVLGSMTARNWVIDAGEELLVIAYDPGVPTGSFALATTGGFYRILADGLLHPVLRLPVREADLHRSSVYAIDTGEPASTPNATAVLLMMYDAAFEESAFGIARGVAVADYADPSDPILAVARIHTYVPLPTATDAVLLYRIDRQGNSASLVLDRRIPAVQPAFPVFRPPVP